MSKKYINNQIKWLKRLLEAKIEDDRKAVDQYSKTNDEWKIMHNGLQRKMEEDRGQYVTKEMLDKQSQLQTNRTVAIVTITGIVIGALIKLLDIFIK